MYTIYVGMSLLGTQSLPTGRLEREVWHFMTREVHIRAIAAQILWGSKAQPGAHEDTELEPYYKLHDKEALKCPDNGSIART
jgi:hypothetical protein